MDINDIINEESQDIISEIITGADSRIKTYPYNDIGQGTFIIDVDDDDKDVHVKYQVSFSTVGNSEEKVYSIAFKVRGGEYTQMTGFGIQFRILATISKIVKEQVAIYDPNILTFQPVKTGGETGNRRMNLYLQYVKGGAGEDYDSFIIGDKVAVNVEKRNPSFPIENGYQDVDTIQDIITQLSHYGGHYQTDLHPTDPDYEKFFSSRHGGFAKQGSQENSYKLTNSARRIVDWMFSVDDLVYVQGDHEPNPYDVPVEPTQPAATGVDAPIQRVGGDSHTVTAMMGTFEHFLQTEIYGNPEYEILEPFYETVKTINDFNELRSRASLNISIVRSHSEAERLREIIGAIDKLKRGFSEYSQRHGMNENDILNEVEKNLLDLIGE